MEEILHHLGPCSTVIPSVWRYLWVARELFHSQYWAKSPQALNPKDWLEKQLAFKRGSRD